jgi:hypothetical protein
MQVNYCDLCGEPLKDNNFFMLYITRPEKTNFEEIGNMMNYLQNVQREVKEVCPTCKHIFDKIFELRLSKLSELRDEIDEIYNLPSLRNPKERKNGKDKK